MNALEPFAEARRANLLLSDKEAAALSQAISLKRIADALETVLDWRFDQPAIRTRRAELDE